VDTSEKDIIAAIAPGTGGALAMVRLSGPGALALADSVFKPVGTRKPSGWRAIRLPTGMS
jgi:tRNA U34 5-carboxymethylaminomethyl modifying GTPase MnmE/TrmE